MKSNLARVNEVVEVFEQARAAVAAGDWEQVFALLDDAAVQAIGRNSLIWLVLQDRAVWPPALVAALEELQVLHERLSASAQRVLAAPLNERMSVSLAHRDLVKEQDALLQRAVRGQAAALGAIETLRRHRGEGGSVSSQLFLGEHLEDVVIDGNRAVATRVFARGGSERLHFARRRGGWKIQLTRRV